MSSTQTTALPQLASLVRKRARTETPSQTAAAHVEDVTGTPRSTRIRNLLQGSEDERSLSTILEKLLEVTMAGIQFNGKGRMAKKIQVDVESAADILVLVGAAFDRHQLDLSKRVLFQPGRRQVTNPTTTALNSAQRPLTNPLDFQSIELNSKIDALAEQVAALTSAIQKPTPQGPKTPSYALAASKHAPATPGVAPKASNTPRRHPSKPSTIRPTTTITLSQTDAAQPVLTNQSTPRLLVTLNSHLAAKHIKTHETSKTFIEVKSIQRHTFNDLILHLESPSHAEALRKTVDKWLPMLSDKLTLKPETHAILVHGIPTTFSPQNPEHLEDLIASNRDRLASLKTICWMNIKAVEEEKKNYSSLILFLADREAAQRCVRDQIWYRFNKKRTEAGRRPPSQCFNCLKSGHTAAACPQKPLCPYCGDEHHAHTCVMKGTTPPKCTSCAREKKRRDPLVNLKGVFKANPTDLLHSPFDPKCAARLAQTPSNESSHSIRITTRSESDELMTNV